MNNRLLGKSGISVSEIAFGAVEIGMPYGVHKKLIGEEEAVRLLHAAADKGINFFDTARRYGLSEERIGSAFKGIRKNIVISTKCAHLRDSNGKLPQGKSLQKFIEESVSTSLKMLKTDYVDVFLSHSSDAEILASEEIAECFASIKKRGLARTIGVSTYGAKDTKTAIDSGNWDVVQISFNLMDQSCGKLFDSAKQNGIGIMVRSALMRGILTDAKFEYHEKIECIKEHRKKYLVTVHNI